MGIESVAEGSWAEYYGLEVHDLLLRVNGKDVDGYTKKDFKTMMRSERPLTLRLFRLHPVAPADEGSRSQLQRAGSSFGRAKDHQLNALSTFEGKDGRSAR